MYVLGVVISYLHGRYHSQLSACPIAVATVLHEENFVAQQASNIPAIISWNFPEATSNHGSMTMQPSKYPAVHGSTV